MLTAVPTVYSLYNQLHIATALEIRRKMLWSALDKADLGAQYGPRAYEVWDGGKFTAVH